MNHLLRRLIAFFILNLPMISASAVPSFDCNSKLNITESAICNDHHLSILDTQMSIRYIELSKRNSPNLKSSQIAWIRERNSCGENVDCIKNSIQKRADTLGVMIANFDNPPNIKGSYQYLNWRPTGIHSQITEYGNENDELCNDFIKNLNNDLNKSYVLCKIPTIGNGFSRLEWEKLDFNSNKELLETLYKTLRVNKFRKEEFDKFFVQQDKFGLYKLKNEISYKGEKNNIYMISRSCDESDPSVIQNPSYAANHFFLSKKDGSYLSFLTPWNMVDILSYKGNLYSYSFEMTVALHKEMNAAVNNKWHHQINLFGLEGGSCRFVYTQ